MKENIITAQEAREIALRYLESKQESFENLAAVDKVIFWKGREILTKKHYGVVDDIFSICFYRENEYDDHSYYVQVSAHTGLVYGIMGPATYREPD